MTFILTTSAFPEPAQPRAGRASNAFSLSERSAMVVLGRNDRGRIFWLLQQPLLGGGAFSRGAGDRPAPKRVEAEEHADCRIDLGAEGCRKQGKTRDISSRSSRG